MIGFGNIYWQVTSNSANFGVGDTLSSLSDILNIYHDVKSIMFAREGKNLFLKGWSHYFDGCNWNHELSKFHMALGQWMQDFAVGWLNHENSEYFNRINNQLQEARDEYHNFLYSVTNPNYVPGVDFQAEDLDYADYDFCDPRI